MDQTARDLAQYLAQTFAQIAPTQRLIVGIAGVPASGKSTLAVRLVQYTNDLLRQKENVAILVGLDGWHLTRAQLDAFPDAKLAHDRRGAHWTFDAQSYVSFVRELRQPLPQPGSTSDSYPVIYAPSFSHELKDPTPRTVAIRAYHRLVVIEGLYAFLSIDPWVNASRLLDERWWVELGEEEAKARLVLRHVLTGVAKDLEEAEWRAKENDAPNGRFIKDNMLQPTKVIQSVEDPIIMAAVAQIQAE